MEVEEDVWKSGDGKLGGLPLESNIDMASDEANGIIGGTFRGRYKVVSL